MAETSKGISRRDFFKMGAILAGSFATGAVFGAWAEKNPWQVIGALETDPSPALDIVADYFDKQAITKVKKELPDYPVELLERNSDYVPLIQQFQMATTKLSGKGITPKWSYAQDFATLDFLKNKLPDTADFRRASPFGGEIFTVRTETEKRLFSDPEIPKSLKNLFLFSDHAMANFADAGVLPDNSFNDLAAKVVSKAKLDQFYDTREWKVLSDEDRARISGVIKTFTHEMRQFVEEKVKQTRKPLRIWELMTYFGEKNKGDLVRTVADMYIFFGLTARNSFESGSWIGDSEEARQVNMPWLNKNIVDPVKYGNIREMPIRDLNKDIRRGFPKDARDSMNPVNHWGTIYHLFDSLLLCSKCDYRVVMNMAIIRTMDAGDLKMAREVAAVSEIPETLDFLNKLSQ